MWTGNAFFWGLGFLIIISLLEGLVLEFDKINNIGIKLLVLTLSGGFVMHFYNIIYNKENYKKTIKIFLNNFKSL